ncbi:DUF5337 domain-containing protein [Thalassobium sp. R2A62]|jgi:threonine/homoserine/homoserine lactone efflux protein|uniref:DUF5337 domain-containing protein n=1 Tax=Thalassobium sp. R2A62 TaxID=633131 RepID=UPI0001B1D7BD|nr:DUF5337 domain-containing protein [Thalassobium sp. R2A62]EET48757.1 hypothetical protein TR2A62_1179 [Thalassobium sp. R2A62]MDG1339019.1 DUF5337 domain-containing protein [Paracoccaceae bacterium]MDG2452710.1 DUF5337 domain-containing protein [Paracoccaceae bacterium]
MKTEQNSETSRIGRRIAVVIAGTGLFWIGATWIGGQMGLSLRVRALFDLIALAGFGWALWMTYRIWRSRQD